MKLTGRKKSKPYFWELRFFFCALKLTPFQFPMACLNTPVMERAVEWINAGSTGETLGCGHHPRCSLLPRSHSPHSSHPAYSSHTEGGEPPCPLNMFCQKHRSLSRDRLARAWPVYPGDFRLWLYYS